MSGSDDIGIIVIGRNEGARLRACLASLDGCPVRLIYVDSGSTDGSVAAARQAGAHIVELDMSRPFTAARARNAGLAELAGNDPPAFVQFLDGDCTLASGWLTAARTFLQQNPSVVAVSGRLRERHPERSLYNRLCDAEWNTPTGRSRACGGIVLMRFPSVMDAGGFREDLIAGEEPELCVRLRAAGGEIWRIDHEMGWHDAEMTRFSQWWRRSRRAGFAFAEGYRLHGRPPERHFALEMRRILVWAGLLPIAILSGALIISPWALLGFALYPLQVVRLAKRVGWERAAFLSLGRFAEMQGVLEYQRQRLSGARRTLIEYK
ncbi:glycosyltransferase family A protein [Tropicimonas sp. TH_r6]|uniref:glycosyltransferase n=1 Tax=Tropicimonas sp. TH_r6 TaxID=3082085 RepID=UPI0029551362|nr:glycosyltransferase family A protein [Tropicimonas sp. TH_r6]MDV7141171.1 glycosyltransferase family A protein [Tropicimonas sp. TH_r6]